jgi:glycosyltransferase involved in cell wall biosynthesis
MIIIKVWRTPWNIGFSQAFNCGVGLADNDLIIYLAADDTLGPECVADCIETWNANGQKDAWYALTYESPSGGVCSIPINAAMITRNLWKAARGFPPAAFAGPDAAALSCLMIHAPDRIIKVKPGKVNYHIREHPSQETKITAQPYSDEMTSIRNKLTANFKFDPEVILR